MDQWSTNKVKLFFLNSLVTFPTQMIGPGEGRFATDEVRRQHETLFRFRRLRVSRRSPDAPALLLRALLRRAVLFLGAQVLIHVLVDVFPRSASLTARSGVVVSAAPEMIIKSIMIIKLISRV